MMKTNLNFRSVVFKRAYRIVKQSKVTFSEALKLAWKRFREYKERVVNEISSKINGFDSYYYMSDDSRVYNYWSNLQDQIRKELNFNKCLLSSIASRLRDQKNISQFI